MGKTMYKGFDKDLKCRGYQYEEGKEYVHEGEVKACVGGFHACEDPFDVFDFYAPGKLHRFCEVEGSGEEDKKSTISCFEKIKIIAEIGLGGLIKAGVKFCFDRVKWTDKSSATGYCSGASATGDYSGASATGGCSGASATGNYSGASATGYKSGASATGYKSGASVTGNYSGASATGGCSGASATGNYSGASATGDCSGASATGVCSCASATGYKSSASATGNYSSASATGNYSCASATGYKSSASAGKGSVALSVGRDARAKGSLGSWIVLTQCHKGEEDGQDYIDLVKVAKVDGKRIKADTWYTLKEGEFVVADDGC